MHHPINRKDTNVPQRYVNKKRCCMQSVPLHALTESKANLTETMICDEVESVLLCSLLSAPKTTI